MSGACLAGVKPHLMVTDPPFGVNYDPAWRERLGIDLGTLATGKVLNDDRADWREAWALFPGDVAYVWHAALQSRPVIESLEAAGFVVRAQIIWDKTRLVIGTGDYHWQHEPAICCVRKGRTGHWEGGRSQTTVWQIPHRRNDSGHGTEKPVECMKRPIENNSSPGQAVYEPFCGSGSTIIAAEMTGRSCHAIELNPAYVDVAIRRWQDFTGDAAVLAGNGCTFDQATVDVRRASTAATDRSEADPPHRQQGNAGVSTTEGGAMTIRVVLKPLALAASPRRASGMGRSCSTAKRSSRAPTTPRTKRPAGSVTTVIPGRWKRRGKMAPSACAIPIWLKRPSGRFRIGRRAGSFCRSP